MGDLVDPETEHRRYILEINNIIAYYDKATEIGKMALKWKDFKASIFVASWEKGCDFSTDYSRVAHSHGHLISCLLIAYLFVVWLCNVYTKSAEEVADFRVLSIGTREKLLKWGLTDR